MENTDHSSRDQDSLIAGGQYCCDQPPRGPRNTEFLIAITATYFLTPEAAREAVGSSVSSTTELSLSLPEAEGDEAGPRGDVACALALVHVEPQDDRAEVANQIVERCRQMAAEEDPPSGGGPQRLDVEIEVFLNEFPSDDYRTIGAGEDEVVLSFVAASEWAIEGLERVRVKDEKPNCVVCLEDILVGSEATRLPCSHQFHGECIVKWLNTSKFCPLCRFELSG